MSVKSVRSNGVERYSAIAQGIHWLTALMVLAAYSTGLGGPESRVYLASRDFERQLHESLGMIVFVLIIVRVIWRLIDERPDPPEVSRWMGLGAKLVQGGIFVLLFAVPMTAVAGAWLADHPVILLGGIEVPALFGGAHDLGQVVADIHTWLGNAIMWFAGLHAVAAIYHHVVMRDEVLDTMLPRWVKVWRPED